MSDYSSQESRRKSVVGSYSPNRLFIRTSSQADLNPEFGEPFPGAVATHAHEYIHYMHNISTPAGLHLFVANLWIAKSLKHGTDARGHYRENFELNDEQSRYLRIARIWTNALWGGIEGGPPAVTAVSEKWDFGRLARTVVRLPLVGPEFEVEGAEIDVTISGGEAPTRNGKIQIGYDLISEGIAYEVDRGVRRNAGVAVGALDNAVPLYPYLVFGLLIDHLVGRETGAEERIVVGVSALLSTSPGASLVDACERLREHAVMRSVNELREIFSPVRSSFDQGWREILESTIRPELVAVSGEGALRSASEDVLKLIEAALKSRAEDNYFELRFCSEVADEKSYYGLVFDLVDCCVIQEQPGDAGFFEWVGRGAVGVLDVDVANIAVLQSLLEFAIWHRSDSLTKFKATSALLGMSCPFFCACEMRQDICKTSPWQRFPDASLKDPKCWFSAGIVAFSNS